MSICQGVSVRKRGILVTCLVSVLSIFCGQQELGVKNGCLSPCNGRWNCVISQEVDGQKPTIQPIPYEGSRQGALAALIKILKSLPGTEIITQRSDYLHVIFTTWLWKFVDDVEFYLPEDEKVIQVRSASRVGKWDLGLNKRRVKKIAKQFKQTYQDNL